MGEFHRPFELMRFPAEELAALRVEADDVVLEGLTESGVPLTWVAGTLADEHLSLVRAEDGASLIRFGSERRGLPIAYCVHPETGAVSSGELTELALVNASLSAFTETVRQVMLLYPFYTPGPP